MIYFTSGTSNVKCRNRERRFLGNDMTIQFGKVGAKNSNSDSLDIFNSLL